MIMPPNDSVFDRHGRECDQIVDEFIKSRCANNPEKLFHYTSVAGFEAIIRNGTLWATALPHMNDPTELIHGVEKFNEYLQQKLPILSGDLRKFWDKCLSGTDNSTIRKISDQFFSISFSKKEDDLNQWRSYAKDCSGFSLEFSYDFINSYMKDPEIPHKHKFFSSEIFYDYEVFHVASDKIIALTNKYASNERTNDSLGFLINVITASLRLSFYQKNKHYREEKEWRILIYMGNEKQEQEIEYRTRGNSLVPYTEFNWKSATPCPLKRVWIGPAAAHDTTPESVKAFLKHHGYGDEIEVLKSDFQYRSL
ncbi:DUF2971 domain-containing protein [Azospirillum griseum]|uniref:DUF2971 domain-containing protein n=1 Tax=Azospirillum griseum TaxID=2496639 RepID=A0A3S0K4P6_9PROT|nr:DUF2971 domain-containing protein [Azospirillum griseum]RTR19855.1 DUF2971 domain-containing protein [Azospirillum griseum]